MWGITTKAISDSAQLYQWTEFNRIPGIYFEEIKLMNLMESVWKLVIELDVGAIEIRYQQLQNYVELWKSYRKYPDMPNIMKIIQKDEAKLTLRLTHLRALYKTLSNRRRLINAIGTISQTLFGTMDADDARVVNEQLDLLRNNQKTIQHVVINQLKVLDATIGHMNRLEKTLKYNENATQRMGSASKVRTTGRYR